MAGIAKYTKEQGKEFIKLARKSIESGFSGEKIQIPDKTEFRQARGVFVTLTKNKALRGCIGLTHSIYPIGETIVKMARAAAFEDPRFSPLKQEELKDIKIEISILTEPSEVKGNIIKNFELGKDGLICGFMGYSALFLPQVATEHKMNKIEFLENLCQKAGLPKDNWQNKNTRFYKFQVQIFEEE